MSLPSFSETTIRNLLLKEIEKLGVKTATEVQYPTALGTRKPDALLQNGGNYIVETKLGPQAKLLDAITQLYDYTKYIQAAGGFAILLPDELRRSIPIEWLERIARDPELEYVATAIFEDDRPSQRFKGSLKNLADWISVHVLSPPDYVEPDTTLAINVLNDAVDYITASTVKMGEEDLEDIFGGKTVFDNILQYEEGKYPLEEMRKAATYLLINQILFYHVLSSNDPITFPKIEEDHITETEDIALYFRRVLEIDYTPTFGFDVVSRLPDTSVDVMKRVIKAIKGIAPEKIKFDLLGKIFHDLIPFEVRKAVAAFYTNNEAGELLAQLSIDDPHAKVMDLACGSGTLLVSAYHRKRELVEKSGEYFGLEYHKQFLENDITGIDIMPFAAHLAVVHLSLQAPIYETEKVRVAVWDSTELKPSQKIPPIYSELREAYKRPKLDAFVDGKPAFEEKAYIQKGTITHEGIGGEEVLLDKADVIIMNPPFTRQERIPKDYKEELNKRLKKYDDKLSGRMGLYGYFIFLADIFLKAQGKLAFVLPATVLRITSTYGIREFLVNNYEVEHILTTYQKAAFSEGAQFREILLIAKKKSINNETPCTVTFLKNIPKDVNEVKELTLQLKDLRNNLKLGEVYKSKKFILRNIDQTELEKNSDNLFKFIACEDLKLLDIWKEVQEISQKKLVRFSNFLENVDGSIEEGARARSQLIRAPIGSLYILFSESRANKRYDRWIIKKDKGNELEIENLINNEILEISKDSLYHGIRRLSGIEAMNLSEKSDYVLVDKFDEIDDFFIEENVENIKFDLTDWKKYIEQRLSKMFIAFRFDISASGTNLFAWYSSIPLAGCGVLWNIKGITDDQAKILTLWFNSTIHALQMFLERVETRGAWMRLDKYVMEKLLILNLLTLSSKEKNLLLNTFDEVKNEKFPSFLEQLASKQKNKKKIDRVILKILGYDENKIDEILSHLYQSLHEEIIRLKELMAG